jgi:hypothetical protein
MFIRQKEIKVWLQYAPPQADALFAPAHKILGIKFAISLLRLILRACLNFCLQLQNPVTHFRGITILDDEL